jgi:hypothetical protein
MTLHPIPLNFILFYEENFVLFFISVICEKYTVYIRISKLLNRCIFQMGTPEIGALSFQLISAPKLGW